MDERMTFEERYRRDGDRWRYIYLLEQQLDARKTRRIALVASLILNILAIIAIAVLFRSRP